MKQHLALLLISVLILTACGPTPDVIPGPTPSPTLTPMPSPTLTATPSPTLTPTPSSTPTPITSDEGLNLLIVAQGPVRLKRDGWPNYQPTAFGAALRRGDMLQLGPSTHATVLCADLTVWPVPAGAPSGVINGCPPPQELRLVRGGSLIGATRGPVDPLIPYVISPRKTRLLSEQPTLHWNAVAAANTYTIHVHGNDGSDWWTETTLTRMVYPASAPTLRPGVIYSLLVEVDNGRTSREEGTPELGFSLLEPDEAESVRADAVRLHNLALPAEAESYALAHLYAGHGLVAEAIEKIEALAEDGSRAGAVYRTLGDLCRQIGLNFLAETYYLTAVKLAEAAGDVEGLAATRAGLGEVYAALGKVDQAIDRITQARVGYEDLGDAQHAGELAKRLAELNK